MHYPRTIAYGCTSSYRFKTIWSNQLGVLSSLSFIVSALNQSLAVRTSSHTTVNCPMSHQQGTNVVSLFDWVFSSFVLLSFHLHSFPSILWALQGRLNGETSAMICVPTFWHNCECTSMMYYVITSHLIWNHVRVPNSIFTVVLCHSTCSPSFAFAGTHIRTTLSRLQVLRPQTVIPWPFTSIHLSLLWWHDMTTSSQHLEGFRKCNCNDATPICLKSSPTFVFLWKSQGQSMWWCLHELNHPTKILN